MINTIQQQTFFTMENVCVFDITSFCFHGNGIFRKIRSIKKSGNNLTMKQMFDTSAKMVVGQSDEIFGVNTINWEHSSWKYLSLNGDEQVISLQRTKVFVFTDSVLCLGKIFENFKSNNAWEQRLEWFKLHRNTETWTELMVSQWILSGISSQDSPHCSSATKSKSSCRIWAQSQKNSQVGIRKEVVFSLQRKTTRRMGQSRWIDEDQIQRKRTPSFPSHCPEERSKAKKVENYRYTSALMWENCFSDNYFCSSLQYLRSILRLVVLVKQERGDPWWQDNLTHCLCQQVRWWKHQNFQSMILRKKIYFKGSKNERKGYHNKVVWLSFVQMQDSWQQLTSDSFSWQKTLNNSHNLQNQWLVVSTICHEMKIYLNRMVGSEGTLKLDPYWKSQPVTCEVDMEWKFKLNLQTKTLLTRGSEFLMAWISWSRIWATRRTTTMSRKFLRCSSKICVENECICFCEPIEKLKQNHEDVLLLVHLQKLYISVKDLGLILSQKIFRLSLAQCQNNWVLFFVKLIYLEKKMEQLNSGDYKIIFKTILFILDIRLMKGGRASSRKEEETRKDFSIVLILQEKFFTSELVNVIQDAILLIFHCRTMFLFRTILSSTFLTSDVQSTYIPSQILDW